MKSKQNFKIADHPKYTKQEIYDMTTKPNHYIKIRNPRTPQDYRQLQFNNWCERKKVYSGAYLPSSCDKLLDKGWIETTNPICQIQKPGDHREFIRKSSGQKVRFDLASIIKGIFSPSHYHWSNLDDDKKTYLYYNSYEEKVKKGETSSHIAPIGKEFKSINLRKWICINGKKKNNSK